MFRTNFKFLVKKVYGSVVAVVPQTSGVVLCWYLAIVKEVISVVRMR